MAKFQRKSAASVKRPGANCPPLPLCGAKGAECIFTISPNTEKRDRAEAVLSFTAAQALACRRGCGMRSRAQNAAFRQASPPAWPTSSAIFWRARCRLCVEERGNACVAVKDSAASTQSCFSIFGGMVKCPFRSIGATKWQRRAVCLPQPVFAFALKLCVTLQDNPLTRAKTSASLLSLLF